MIITYILLAFPIVVIAVGSYLSDKGYEGPVSDHFNGRTFKTNRGKRINGFKEIIKLVATRKPGKWTRNYETYQNPTPFNTLAKDETQITFVNHSTFLIQMNGLNILTDPVWSERCSPFTWAGPRRMRPPGIPFENLPNIDIVLLSHNHYDHLDIDTLTKLEQTYHPTFLVPLGVDKTKGMEKFRKVNTTDWDQETTIESLTITATEAIHYGSRGLFDRNKTLCCGYMIQGLKNIYYVGDTAYDDEMFKALPVQYPDIDISLIPIGAYKPRWFMKLVHVNPYEALLIHQDIQSKYSIACHFGTFPLADDAEGEAPDDLVQAIKEFDGELMPFIVPEEGVCILF